MDNIKSPKYYLMKIIEDIKFAIKHTRDLNLLEFSQDEVLNSAISFKFIQISENAKKLSDSFVKNYMNIPWQKINGLRNKIVYDYGSIQLEIIYDTIVNDLPILLIKLEEIICI